MTETSPTPSGAGIEIRNLVPDVPMPEGLEPFVHFRHFSVADRGEAFHITPIERIGDADGGFREKGEPAVFPRDAIDAANRWVMDAYQHLNGGRLNPNIVRQLDNVDSVVKALVHEATRKRPD